MGKQGLLLLGKSGNTAEMLECAQDAYDVRAILDDRATESGETFEGVPVLPFDRLAEHPDAQVLCLIGSVRSRGLREGVIARLALPRARFATLVHPDATLSRHATIGRGVALWPGVRVMAGARIGDHVLVLANSAIHHDAEIGARTLVGGGVTIAGGCRVGEDCFIGAASSLRDGIAIGGGAVVGMAANVIQAVRAGAVVAGNPARPLGQAPDGRGEA